MDIKEIALNVADSMSNTTIIMPKNEDSIAFAEAIIESYKAELLKEVRGPVAEFKRHPFGDYTELSFSAGYSARRGDKLYTSDQIAAAIAKATKPLEEEIERLKSEQTELIDRFQNENCGRVHMGEPVISQSIKETVRQWLDIRANENVAIDIDQLVKIAQGNLQEEAAQYKDELAMVLRCSADLRSQLAAAQEEIKTVTEQKNRMWFEMQTAQDQLAKAEQRVAEACAEVCDEQDHPECWIHKDCAEAIRSGEWRKFVKEG